MWLRAQPEDEEASSAAAKAYQRKLSVTSNSVYEAGAADGCRITCAYQNELWSTAATADGTVETDGQDATALRNTVTTVDYVGMLQDAISARKHLVLLGSMVELQKHDIAQRLGKFSPQAQEAWIRMQSPEKQKQERARRETLNPWVIGAPVVVDVWVMPWCNQADLMLQCQLAYMLSRDDFWTKHSYLRICGVVGPFGELGADVTMDDGATLEERRAQLYNQVWRSMRIPATIEVFNVKDVAPDVWESCIKEKEAADKWSGTINSPPHRLYQDVATDSGQRALCTVLNAVILEQNANTAVSICTSPSVPLRSDEGDEGAMAAASAERFVADVAQLTAEIGPTMLVKALPGSNVVTTDL